MSEHRSTCQPSLHPVPGHSAPCKGERPGTCSFLRGETRLPASPRESPSEERTLSISAETRPRAAKGRSRGVPAAQSPPSCGWRPRLHSAPAEPAPRAGPAPPPQGASLGPRAAPGLPRRSSGAAAKAPLGPGHRPAARRSAPWRGDSAAQPYPALPRSPGTCGPAGAPPAAPAPSDAAPALDTGGRP